MNPTADQIASRTHINLTDFSLALAAGSGGALAFTTRIALTLWAALLAVLVGIILYAWR